MSIPKNIELVRKNNTNEDPQNHQDTATSGTSRRAGAFNAISQPLQQGSDEHQTAASAPRSTSPQTAENRSTPTKHPLRAREYREALRKMETQISKAAGLELELLNRVKLLRERRRMLSKQYQMMSKRLHAEEQRQHNSGDGSLGSPGPIQRSSPSA